MSRAIIGRLSNRVTGLPRIHEFTDGRAKKFRFLMTRAGRTGSPSASAARSVSAAILLGIVLIPSGMVLALLVSPYLVLLAAVPVIAYFLPEVELRDAVAKRSEGVAREMPFFSVLVNVLGGAGLPLYNVFESLASTDIFRAMKLESQVVHRDVRIFGLNPLESYEKLADVHPSGKFGEFLLGYASKVRSGGDLPGYLAGESRALLQELEDSWTRFSTRAGVIGSLMVTMFGVVPLLLLIVGFFSPSASAFGLLAFALLGVPVLAGALILMAGRMQPASDQPLGGNWKGALLLSASGLGAYLVSGAAWAGLAVGVFVFFVAYGYSVRSALKEAQEIDEAVPRFLKDLMEYKRQDYDLNRAIVLVSSQVSYSPAFDRVLASISTRLAAGVPLNEANVDFKTKLARMAFFVLGQMTYSGGGDVDTLFQLARYSSKVVEMKRNTQAEMKPYLVLSYVTPVLLVLGVAFVGGILGSYHLSAIPGQSPSVSGSATTALKEASSMLVISTAAALGIVGSKMMDLTVRNTLRAATNLLVAVAAVEVVPLVNVGLLLHAV